ncbi:MAG: FAD-dependent monooxygenase [Hyphomonadaceae bacterium]|nr:FAD-dependent monooxygenase [Hyphomonadaceae bacterium]
MQVDAEPYHIVIAGGGSIGLALACALCDALGSGLRIAIVDRVAFGSATGPRDGRASAVSAGSQHLLAVLGVWPQLAQHAQPVTAVDITDSALDDVFRPVLVSYDNTVGGGEPATYIIENERLNAAILAGVSRRPSIVLIGGAAVADYAADQHGVTVVLADGRRLRSPLLIAADGRGSRLRAAAGIGVVGWAYQQVGIVVTVSHEKPHRARALQHFLPAGPFAILPLTGHRSCITWTEEEDVGRAIVALDDAGFLSEIERRFGHRLGRTELAGPRGLWPLEMHLARALVADRLVLVGDAAHLVHPIAGQGLNLGFRDVAALTEVVADAARLGLDIGSSIVLSRYERWRRTDAALSAAAFDGLNRLFSSDWTLLRTARSAGLGLVNRLPALKQFFVAEAAGLTGEVPKLLRGEPV